MSANPQKSVGFAHPTGRPDAARLTASRASAASFVHKYPGGRAEGPGGSAPPKRPLPQFHPAHARGV